MARFLSPEWFAEVDKLVASAGDLKLTPAMREAEINLTVKSSHGETQAHVKEGLVHQGHSGAAPTAITLDEALARKIFVEADAAAGIAAFVTGELVATGDLKPLVALQMEEPTAEQKALAKRIAAITD